MEEKKILNINPSDFSFSNNKTKKKKTENKPEGNIRVRNTNAKKQTNTLRKKSLLNLIRQHQQKQYDIETNLSKPEHSRDQQITSFNKEFEEAKNYLNTVAEKRTSSVSPHNATMKNYPSPEPMSLALKTEIPMSNNTPTELPSQPEYGCLKNGNLPTYRSYMNKTVSNKEPLKIGNDVDRSSLYNVSNNKPAEPAHSVSQPTTLHNRYPSLYDKNKPELSIFSDKKKKSQKVKQRKTIRRKHKVGRSKYYSKIGVLVSNRTIRATISNQIQQLKMIPIHEVRSHLIKNGFIKVGSNTPNDVLRKMYESALLICGEVKNHNPDNLLYNFLNDETKEE
jgi:hypothetical protein